MMKHSTTTLLVSKEFEEQDVSSEEGDLGYDAFNDGSCGEPGKSFERVRRR